MAGHGVRPLAEVAAERFEQEGATVFNTDVVASRIVPLERSKPAA